MIELAYLAGFFDGEGNIRLAKNPQGTTNYYLRISATQVDPAPLEIFKARFGGYLYRRNKRVGADGFQRQPIWDWIHTGPGAARTLTALIPYLVVKRGAAELAVQFQTNRKSRSRRPLDRWEIAERLSFVEALAARTETFTRDAVQTGWGRPKRVADAD